MRGRLSARLQLLFNDGSSCCSIIIISVALVTVASSASTAKDNEQSSAGQVQPRPLEHLPNDVTKQARISPLDVSSGLSMLPKMKLTKAKYPEGRMDEDYYYSDEDAQQERALLERFIEFLEDRSGSEVRSDENEYDWLPKTDDDAQKENVSEDGGSTAPEAEVTSPVEERDTDGGGHVPMTSEHMTSVGAGRDDTSAVAEADAKARRQPRIKRDLNEEIYDGRWISDDEYPEVDDQVPYVEDYPSNVGLDLDYAGSEYLDRHKQVLRSAAAAAKRDGEPAYIPVVYRGVEGIFVPSSSLATVRRMSVPAAVASTTRRRSLSPVSAAELNSAADEWSTLVGKEVKRALDEYDLVYRLADALQQNKN